MLGEMKEEMPQRERYVSYREAEAWVKNHQPAEPTNPVKPFAHELRIELLDQLGFETQEQSLTTYYPAISTLKQMDAITVLGMPRTSKSS